MTTPEALRQLIGLKPAFFAATVVERDDDARTCTLAPAADPEARVLGVSYIAFGDPEAETLIAAPTLGSRVRAAYTDLDQQHAVLVSVESYEFYRNPCRNVEFGQGSNGGLVKVQPLFDAIERLETTVNGLIVAVKSHVHPANGAVSPGLAALSVLTPYTDRAALENTEFVH